MRRPPMTGLREIRTRRGLTQGQLGKLIDRSNAFIAELELGYKGASIDTLQRLATVLDVPMESLLATSIADDATPRIAAHANG